MEIPYGYCHCGCSKRTKVALSTCRTQGKVKGEPMRFIHNHHARVPIKDRFWTKVARGGTDECWEWQASTMRGGYGQIRYRGKQLKAHRISWEMANGPIPDAAHVLHRCDNPLCVNPGHLFLGTHGDNMADAASKKRLWLQAPNARPPSAKLTPDIVRAIRSRHAGGERGAALAREYGVAESTIHNVLKRKAWTSIS